MRHLSVTIALIVLIFSFFIYNSCSSGRVLPAQPIRFVIINNTSPDSPYEDYSPQLENTTLSINRENPVFTVHCGNIIHGGSSAMGINYKDIEKQFRQFYKFAKKLHSILFTVCGPMDIYNDSTNIYTQFTQKNAWYSFNYGTNHFVVLFSNNPDALSISDTQLLWLKEDLKKHSLSHIFIFSYFLPNIHRTKQQFTTSSHQNLHQLLMQYNVKAFFGAAGITHPVTIGTIQYIPVTADNNYTNKYKKAIRYYVVDFDGHEIIVVPRYF
ncbi:MAG: hypothetical protein N3F66_08815 [Spirochaetes bacterium]|nr:hypothetical protein [Spirochaetota bacterium]